MTADRRRTVDDF